MITFSGVAGGQVGTRAPGLGLGTASTHFIQTFKNAFFSTNLG